eukprot:gene14779-31404_t
MQGIGACHRLSINSKRSLVFFAVVFCFAITISRIWVTSRSYTSIKGHFASDNRFEYLNLSVYNPYNEWVAGYDVTDTTLAILKESEFKWFVATNGDNIYDPRFLNYLPSHNDVDIVTVDYWSRYERACYKPHPINMNVSVCHRAELKLGYVDLGGMILSLPRFHKENLKFMNFG